MCAAYQHHQPFRCFNHQRLLGWRACNLAGGINSRAELSRRSAAPGLQPHRIRLRVSLRKVVEKVDQPCRKHFKDSARVNGLIVRNDVGLDGTLFDTELLEIIEEKVGLISNVKQNALAMEVD